MFGSSRKKQLAAAVQKLAALDRSQAVIEFTPAGIVTHANKNFLAAMGYSLDEIVGKHHRIFVDTAYAESYAYELFWQSLAEGKFQSAEFRRIAKNGQDVWIEASYNPIIDEKGNTIAVVKYATDVTARKLKDAEYVGQVAAINKSQAVIEFEMDGTIITANQNFLDVVGYTLSEIQGKHHRIFVDPRYAASAEYIDFWAQLKRGEFSTGEYKRFAKSGKEIWLNATYNPILNMAGKPFKVIKFAADVTAQVARVALVQSITENIFQTSEAITKVSNESAMVSRATDDATNNVQTVAAAAEEMSASVREISENMNRSQAAVNQAVGNADTADTASKRLVSAAESMGNIISLINNIASQINLLALNATIESARAGEAGKGFAVVASEVKNLAGQTTKATEQIAREIEAMQSVSGEVVRALGAIRSSIESVSEFISGVAGAIEEQSAVNNEIVTSMQRASGVMTDIRESMNGIAISTKTAQEASDEVSKAAQSISA